MALTGSAPFYTIRPFGLLQRIVALVSYRDTPVDADDARERRSFVQDMISRNPNAFSSDLDVQAMMHHFPGQF